MAIGWLSVLKMLPWSEVIKSAPELASGAKKLWQMAAKKPFAPDAAKSPEHAAGKPQPTLDSLHNQLLQFEISIADLQQQMLQSSALIESLAEQNSQLVAQVEVNRKWILLLALTCVLLLAALVALVVGKI